MSKKQKLKERVLIARAKSSMTQEEFAQGCKVSRQILIRVENGEEDTLLKVSRKKIELFLDENNF